MITHFSHLQLHTVSIPAVKQFYGKLLKFPIQTEMANEVHFQVTDTFVLSFKEAYEPISPAHIAFEVPFSSFEQTAEKLRLAGIIFVNWPDGRTIDEFDHGKNVYFRDLDGHLLEMICHSYVQEGVLPASGAFNILYLREIGFPVDSVVHFREQLVSLLGFRLAKVFENFTFAIGGTAHAVVSAKTRKWIPIDMIALPPAMEVGLGTADPAFLEEVKQRLAAQSIAYEQKDGELHFKLCEYRLCLQVTSFDADIPCLLQLPLSV